MIGQNKFKKDIQEFIERETFPRFSIIVGEEGSGRKEAGKEIANRLGCPYIVYENKAEDMRDLIELAYSQTKPIVYCIPNYEDMAPGTRSIILKVCEEVPQNAYIIMTAVDRWSILNTLLSRATIFELEDYTDEELEQIASLNEIDKNLIEYCKTPGELFSAKDVDLKEFKMFIENVWQNIGLASEGNCLKIGQKLKLKEESKGFDIWLFLNGLWSIIEKEIKVGVSKPKLLGLGKLQQQIMNAKRELGLKYNKTYIIDELLLRFREVLSGII